MKIYLAARYSKRPTLYKWGEQLEALGHEIVSRWSKRGGDHNKVAGLSPKAATSERQRFAAEDLEDIQNCQLMISLMEEPRNNSRGGRHVEFGYADALGKNLVIIGQRETVFHEQIHIEQFDTFEEFFASFERHTRHPVNAL